MALGDFCSEETDRGEKKNSLKPDKNPELAEKLG